MSEILQMGVNICEAYTFDAVVRREQAPRERDRIHFECEPLVCNVERFFTITRAPRASRYSISHFIALLHAENISVIAHRRRNANTAPYRIIANTGKKKYFLQFLIYNL